MTNEIDKTELLTDGSPRYNKLASGAWVDRAQGNKIVAREITSEEARAMVNTRWDRWKSAAASAMLKEAQAINPYITTEEDAWAFLFAKQYVAFLDAEKPRGKDLVSFGQVIGAMPTIVDKPQPQELPQPTQTEEALRGLLHAILDNVEMRELLRPDEVLEAEIKEG